MSDLIQLVPGCEPWRPSPEAESVRVLDEYNIPLAGVVRQHGHDYFYVCAAGEEQESNVWLYSLIEAHELETLGSLIGGAFVNGMMEFLKHRPVTAAMADDWKLVLWESFDSGDERPGTMVRRFLKLLEARVRRYGDNIGRLERDPSIDADDQLSLHI
ncbi:hypothetical protein [Nocardioides xinjiangensis]|uniref:hypothetical protein n=1 Tax=Nocardioides xinjiangensis TaxID=2817376 RepID=UPI001B307CC8|nr:hypothetical protein [Nocardioides sp. SYSU D00778]